MLTLGLLFPLGLVALVAYWARRPNRAEIDPRLELETWIAVGDGLHNSNTGLIFWRQHFYLGHAEASTLIAVAEPPFTQWAYTKSRVTRLDGPALFSYEGRVYAVARYQPDPRGPLTRLGSMLSRKRTSLFLVESDRLLRLSDLPSAGDTSYAGVVLRDGALWASYYTSDVERDFPCALGMIRASEIRMARVGLESLTRLAAAKGD